MNAGNLMPRNATVPITIVANRFGAIIDLELSLNESDAVQDFSMALDKIVYVLQEMDEGRRRAAAAAATNGNNFAMKKSSRAITVV